MLIKMYLYVLCWCFIEVCEENLILVILEIVFDIYEREIKLDLSVEGIKEVRIKSMKIVWEEVGRSGIEFLFFVG